MATWINSGWPFLISVSEQQKAPRKSARLFANQCKCILYILRTFDDWGPFWPSVTSKLTLSPSARDLKPSPWTSEKCTNTSGPLSCSIKPKPFASLNHFTVPSAIFNSMFPCGNVLVVQPYLLKNKKTRNHKRSAWHICD